MESAGDVKNPSFPPSQAGTRCGLAAFLGNARVLCVHSPLEWPRGQGGWGRALHGWAWWGALTLLLLFQVKLVNIRNDDITDGNPKLTLGLIWTIILHFQVGREFLPEGSRGGWRERVVSACFVAMPARRSVWRISTRRSVMETGVGE